MTLAGVLLRGLGQVVFLPHVAAGALILAAVALAVAAGTAPPAALAGVVLGTGLATLTGRALRSPPEAVSAGLYGFNGALVGLAVPILVPMTPALWAALLAGAAAAALLTAGLARILAPWGLPGLTAPFVAITWAICLWAGLPEGAALPAPPLGATDLPRAMLAGLSQIFLIDDPLAGAVILAALAIAAPKAALIGAAASVAATLAACLLGLPATQIAAGLWAYSPILTALALAAAFPASGWRGAPLAAAATLATIAVQIALAPLCATAGIPVLTAPFILATWLALALRRV